MRFLGTAEKAAEKILEAFKNPSGLPKALAQLFIQMNDDCKPCSKWSWANQLLVALFGYHDARGFRQWEEVGRHVRKGEKSFPILVPLKKQVTRANPKTGEEEAIAVIYGFKSCPVFGLEQTEGDPLPSGLDSETEAWLSSLPFREVAEAWGLRVAAYSGKKAGYLGYYKPGTAIGLGTKNLSTWAHELVHASDDQLGNLNKRGGQQLDNEVVAEFGGAILLSILGLGAEADYGGCWEYLVGYATAHKKDTFRVCLKFLSRTCEAVAHILGTADKLAQATAPARQAAFVA